MPRTPPRETIKLLNEALTGQLTAVNQFFLHAEMCSDWGFVRLHGRARAESIARMKTSKNLIDRVLYLGGVPNVQRFGALKTGADVQTQLANDLETDRAAVDQLNAGVEALRNAGDNGSRLLLESILAGEEAHVDWLEAQIEQISQIGLQNFLAEQV